MHLRVKEVKVISSMSIHLRVKEVKVYFQATGISLNIDQQHDPRKTRCKSMRLQRRRVFGESCSPQFYNKANIIVVKGWKGCHAPTHQDVKNRAMDDTAQGSQGCDHSHKPRERGGSNTMRATNSKLPPERQNQEPADNDNPRTRWRR